MPGPAATLAGRLLCASVSAYAISDDESVLDPEAAAPYYGAVGFTQPPTAFWSGEDDINACLVGTTGDGVVVAFRGTLPLDGPFTRRMLLDWFNDLNLKPVQGDHLPGQVHEGFLGSLDFLWDNVWGEVGRQLSRAGTGTPLLVTGHSKGGAVATLAAMRLRMKESLAAKVVTFAAPKPGDSAFANAYNAVMDHTRYEFGDDIAPHLPASAPFLNVLTTLPFLGPRLTGVAGYDYGRVGSLLYIDRSLAITPDPQNTLLTARRERLASLVLSGHLQQIGDDHRSGCGYGYMSALCPAGVCSPPVS